MSENIKPCPKCGSQVKIYVTDAGNRDHKERPSYQANCTNPQCRFEVGFLNGDRYRRSAISDYHKFLKNRKAPR